MGPLPIEAHMFMAFISAGCSQGKGGPLVKSSLAHESRKLMGLFSNVARSRVVRENEGRFLQAAATFMVSFFAGAFQSKGAQMPQKLI
jgi:hypothetical protein